MKDVVKTKYSYGVACCKFINNVPHILLVNKRCTYEFVNFVYGVYPNSVPDDHIIAMFNKMTIDEKIDILSLNYQQIWFRLWPVGRKIQQTLQTKFERIFVKPDNGQRLRKLVSVSQNGTRLWEIPKGHKETKNESNINCAIREFCEETGINKKDFRILPNASRTYTFSDCGINYAYVYYFAIAEPYVNYSLDFYDYNQIGEISDIKWMNINMIRMIGDPRLETLIKPIINYIRNAHPAYLRLKDK